MTELSSITETVGPHLKDLQDTDSTDKLNLGLKNQHPVAATPGLNTTMASSMLQTE